MNTEEIRAKLIALYKHSYRGTFSDHNQPAMMYAIGQLCGLEMVLEAFGFSANELGDLRDEVWAERDNA